jgi:hypothetical protein
MSTRKATLEVWGLRLKNFASTIVQLAGFLLIFVGIYRLFGPSLVAQGVDVTVVHPVTSHVPTIGGHGLIMMVVGLVVVWLSTSPRV